MPHKWPRSRIEFYYYFLQVQYLLITLYNIPLLSFAFCYNLLYIFYQFYIFIPWIELLNQPFYGLTVVNWLHGTAFLLSLGPLFVVFPKLFFSEKFFRFTFSKFFSRTFHRRFRKKKLRGFDEISFVSTMGRCGRIVIYKPQLG